MKILDFSHGGYHIKNRSVNMYGGLGAEPPEKIWSKLMKIDEFFQGGYHMKNRFVNMYGGLGAEPPGKFC